MTTYTYDEQLLSDLHKNAFGFRPTPAFYEDWKRSNEEGRQAIWDFICVESRRAVEREQEEIKLSVENFESSIQKLIEAGAKNRSEAISWIIKSLGDEEAYRVYGGGWVCYELNLPYNMAAEIEAHAPR